MPGRLIVVGAVNTDLVIAAPHLPAPGETVVGAGLQTFGGGKAANAAVAAARMGAQVDLIGAVGADDAGARAVADLQSDRVGTRFVSVLEDTPTGAALIIVDARGENQIAIGPGANGAVTQTHVRDALDESLSASAAVLVSTEIPYDAVATAVTIASSARVQCILNPAPVIPGLFDLLARGPIITPNEIELKDLARAVSDVTGQSIDLENVDACLGLLGERTAAPVIVTLGGDGCAMRLADGTLKRIPAPTTPNVVDTTGAGDTFNGVLATRLAAGDEIIAAVEIAVVAASLSVTAIGARGGMPTADAVSLAISSSPSTR